MRVILSLQRKKGITHRICSTQLLFRIMELVRQEKGFILYKAQAAGLKVVFVNSAYTSQLCSDCGSKGIRAKHRFICKKCGIQRHSDLNASRNIRRIAVSADAATGTVSCPYVAALKG